jgi:hypothetical protein
MIGQIVGIEDELLDTTEAPQVSSSAASSLS